jgi:hypothetical protein
MARLFFNLYAHPRFPGALPLQSFIAFTPDIQAIKDGGARVVLAGGRASKGYYYYRPAPIIAEALGAEFVEFPGHHNGYLDHPDAFAATLRQLLGQLGAAS